MQIVKKMLNQHSYYKGFMQDRPGQQGQTTFPTIVVVPGGSYTHIPEAQAESVALAFFAKGFNAVYLRYSFVGEVTPLLPAPIVELGQTISQLKQNPDLPIDNNAVIPFGMSVGGHIVALYNDYWSSSWLSEATGATASVLEPAGAILGYPVISPVLGFPKDEKTIAQWTDDPTKYAAEQHVTVKNKPVFVWVTNEDQAVPVTNTLSYVQESYNHNLPLELHVFNHGPHGLALANNVTAWKPGTDLPHVAHWLTLAIEWVNDLLSK
ncbi:alpha/beta hydrolase [Furfurilactobacillus rossiae]|uniref:Esterase lipase n=1 Tax=Furfurilactobacillus rossiae DSM 15814 TaxID=1114972 RepID=A0A0R1RJ52_9LACO|nr:alpha/beta hydrolase [Furfurilactobacillus rossiae]KRL56334.1 esterase lipase [Furfurilactobacillus rossiae DSM 15814]MCF6165230.1 alpha/beta hydrolase [Furfurilactobacillus rossiae]QFR67844.1 alpha/beta hydrolase [Furfurilactobacillus rossiae]QLE60825.1 lipase-esterase putative [Furfurilactobacillus rossiae]QLE63590.1 lipase-esterase [Furfurilactobacillus rossiae]